MQDIIIGLGGLQNLDAFTALTAISCDYFAAVGTFELCALDPFERPELVGIRSPHENFRLYSDCHAQVRTVLHRLDPRVRVFAMEAHAHNRMLQTVKTLSLSAIRAVSAAVQQEAMRLYMYPFIPKEEGSVKQPKDGQYFSGDDELTTEVNRKRALTADVLSVLCRHKAVRAWLYFSMVSCARKEVAQCYNATELSSRELIKTPRSILSELSFISQKLVEIPLLLAGVGWAMRKDVMFWMSAVGLLVSSTSNEKVIFKEIFQNLASDLRIVTHEMMEKTLALQSPLQLINDDASLTLWSFIKFQWP